MPAWTYWRVIKELKESTLGSESGRRGEWGGKVKVGGSGIAIPS